MSVLLYVPARGGSKGLPRKNLLPAGGLPLVARAIRVAHQFRRRAGLSAARVLVDTDDPEIADVARSWGAEVPFLRPAALAADDTPTSTTLLHCLDWLAAQASPVEWVVVLQPTSPLRSVEDVLACFKAARQTGPGSAVAVTALEHPLAHAVTADAAGLLHWAVGAPAGRRQDEVVRYRLTGSVYVAAAAWFRRTGRLVVEGETIVVPAPQETALDVDSGSDLSAADLELRARPSRACPVAGRVVGAGQRCLVIAEAGVNHNGDLALAHQLVDAAADAGADAVKFQTFDPAELTVPSAPKAAYQAARTGEAESQQAMLARLTLPGSAWGALAEHARARGLEFLSTPFDVRSATMLCDLGMGAVKVPSGELTNHPFLAALARLQRPMLLSTGMATLEEVGAALEVVEEHGGGPVALFHCVTSYPAAPADCNLRAMETLRAAFGVPVGWSDHSMGTELGLAAVAMGAELIEKHLTLDRSLPGPDHAASLEPAEFRAMVLGIRAVEAAFGSGVKAPASAEAPLALVARRSLHVARALSAGTALGPDDLLVVRPATGLPPGRLETVVGRRLARDVAAFTPLTEDLLA